MKEFSIHISEFIPFRSEDWNEMCLECSNFFQSTYYDEVNRMFKNKPVYFQVFRNEELIAGLKIYTYQSEKLLLRIISRQAHSFGEFVYRSDVATHEEILSLLTENLISYLEKIGCNYFKSKVVYGGIGVSPKHDLFYKKQVEFAVINLTVSMEDLWAGIYKTHQRYIKKAQKNSLEFIVSDNFEEFYKLLQETYSGQSINSPDKKYLFSLYEIASKYNAAELCFVKNKEEYLSAIMVIKFGKRVEYMHGGMKRNMLGSGHFIHWEMMRRYKAAGYTLASFGQVNAAEPNNMKMETVSDFKLKFGCKTIQSFNSEIIFHPRRYHFFKKLQKFAI